MIYRPNKKSWLSISSSISFMRISSQQVFLGSRFCSSKCKRNKYPRPSNFSQGGMSWGYGLWICSIMGSLYSDMCPHFSCPFCPGNPNLLATGFNPCSTFCSQLQSQWHGLYTSLKKNWPHEEEPPSGSAGMNLSALKRWDSYIQFRTPSVEVIDKGAHLVVIWCSSSGSCSPRHTLCISQPCTGPLLSSPCPCPWDLLEQLAAFSIPP